MFMRDVEPHCPLVGLGPVVSRVLGVAVGGFELGVSNLVQVLLSGLRAGDEEQEPL